ncbi:MAG: hypothetical protein JNN03_20655 [Rubrivivax sp.]|nr:hypothetical protein [Rubrivivax sp.]
MLAAVAALLTTGPLSGCGGGVGEGGTGYAAGPITGFGSVIVNDIFFDDSLAQVEDGDGGARTRGDLRLGMTVEIDSDAIVGGGARAARVRFDSAVVGPVESLEADGFVVLGQRVAVDQTTVFDSTLAAGLTALTVGQVVEVYGLYDAGVGRFRATRVEVRAAPLVYRLRGVVAEIDERTRTLRVGTALFAFGSAVSAPADLAVGAFVRIFVATDPPGALGRRQVLRFGEAQRAPPDTDGCSVKGHVTVFNSLADLRVDGRRVDASTAVVSGGLLAIGARVEISGSLRAGVVIATRVAVRSDQDERERGFELRGRIDQVAADRTSIELRGITVSLTRPPVYQDGTVADLAVGRFVEVRGVVSAGNGTRLDALVVKFR